MEKHCRWSSKQSFKYCQHDAFAVICATNGTESNVAYTLLFIIPATGTLNASSND